MVSKHDSINRYNSMDYPLNLSMYNPYLVFLCEYLFDTTLFLFICLFICLFINSFFA